MINIKDPADCCGCTACASICSHDAISMEPDAMGFLYPKVDETRCVDCGLCEKICAFNDRYDKSMNLARSVAYAARHKDTNEVMRSRSGAAFAAISDYILEQGGIVYGAGYADHFRVVHKRATTKEERDEFRGSKYVQSDLFYKHIMFRRSCGKCHFCNTTRPSDITIADFWGWEKNVPGFNTDDKGCSLMLVNTEKGKQIFTAIKDKLNTVEVNLNNSIQPNLQHPSPIHPKREQFEKDYICKGFEYVYYKYGEEGWRNKLSTSLQKTKNFLKRIIKRAIGRK